MLGIPALLRWAIIHPEQITSAPNLRGKLIDAAKHFEETHPLITRIVNQGLNTRCIVTEDLCSNSTPVSQETTMLAATLLAKSIGRWALLGRVDLWRTKRRISDRMNGADLAILLAELGETWLLGEQKEGTMIQKRPRVESTKK